MTSLFPTSGRAESGESYEPAPVRRRTGGVGTDQLEKVWPRSQRYSRYRPNSREFPVGDAGAWQIGAAPAARAHVRTLLASGRGTARDPGRAQGGGVGRTLGVAVPDRRHFKSRVD